MTKELITTEQQLLGATYERGNYSIPVYDDGFGRLYILRDSLSIRGICRAKTWEDAYSICEDEFFPEADESVEELQREYGFKRDHVKIVNDGGILRDARLEDYPLNADGHPTFEKWETRETPDPDAWMENELFCESYGFRPNGPNSSDTHKHGIYQRDLNGESLDVLTPQLIADLGITLDVREYES